MNAVIGLAGIIWWRRPGTVSQQPDAAPPQVGSEPFLPSEQAQNFAVAAKFREKDRLEPDLCRLFEVLQCDPLMKKFVARAKTEVAKQSILRDIPELRAFSCYPEACAHEAKRSTSVKRG